MSISAHIVASLQNLLIAQQALENALADISEPNKQTIQRVVEIIKKEILLLAEQYPIIKDFSSLPGINIIPAINLLLLLQIEKAKSPSSIWKYCGVDVSPTQVKYNSKAHDLCLELAELLSREGFAYSSIYIAEAANTFPERAKLVVSRAMLAHIFEQWKERLGTLEPENIPPDRRFPDRSLYGWPAVEGQRAIDNQR